MFHHIYIYCKKTDSQIVTPRDNDFHWFSQMSSNHKDNNEHLYIRLIVIKLN